MVQGRRSLLRDRQRPCSLPATPQVQASRICHLLLRPLLRALKRRRKPPSFYSTRSPKESWSRRRRRLPSDLLRSRESSHPRAWLVPLGQHSDGCKSLWRRRRTWSPWLLLLGLPFPPFPFKARSTDWSELLAVVLRFRRLRLPRTRTSLFLGRFEGPSVVLAFTVVMIHPCPRRYKSPRVCSLCRSPCTQLPSLAVACCCRGRPLRPPV